MGEWNETNAIKIKNQEGVGFWTTLQGVHLSLVLQGRRVCGEKERG